MPDDARKALIYSLCKFQVVRNCPGSRFSLIDRYFDVAMVAAIHAPQKMA